MINLIGAYIVTLVLAAVLIKGPKFSRISENFEKLPPFIHWALLFFLSFLTYQTMHYNSLNEYQMSFYNIPYIIIEGCNFWVHEAGHVYFMLFGEVMHFFGGTLMQVGLPFFLFLRSVKNQYRLLSTIFLFWFAQICRM